MAITIEEIRSFFTADITGLESADRKQAELSKKAIARERELNQQLNKTAQAMRGRGETAANALANPLRGASGVVDGLVGKLKGLGAGGGVAAAALTLVGKVALDTRKSIEASADALRDLNEEFRGMNNANRFTSAGDGVDSLTARLRGSEELRDKARKQDMERDPYGFDSLPNQNFGHRMDRTLAGWMQPVANFLADPTGREREEGEKRLRDLAVREAQGRERSLRAQRSHALAGNSEMIKEQFRGDPLQANVMALERAKEKADKDATASKLGKGEKAKIAEGFDVQINSLRERQTYDQNRFFTESALAGIRARNVSTEIQSFEAAKLTAQTVREELRSRQNLTEEERRGLHLRVAGAEAEMAALRLARTERKRSILQDRMSTGLRLGVSTGSAAVYDAMAAKGNAMREADRQQLPAQDKKRLSDTHDLRIRDAQNAVKVEAQRYDLARRIQDVEAANTTDAQKRYRTTELQTQALKDELSTRHGLLTVERARDIAQEMRGNTDATRKIRQEVGYGKGEGQILADLRGEATEKFKRDKFDARTASRDGLVGLQKDMAGNITGGIDMVTGERRGVSAEFKRSMQGIAAGGLITRGLNDGPVQIGGIKPPDTSGGNDVAKGRTLIDAARATVDAIDISNRYLENISRQMDTMGLA